MDQILALGSQRTKATPPSTVFAEAPQASQMANTHCRKYDKIAQYNGWIMGLPQMWHFLCVKE